MKRIGNGNQPQRRTRIMPKNGIINDYDLWANREQSSKDINCYVCEKENITVQWSDYSGEAMCTQCGAPYQLKWGTEEQEKEGKYPYKNIKEEYRPILKEYWEETKKFVCYGKMLGLKPGIAEFHNWLEEKHPELVSNDDET